MPDDLLTELKELLIKQLSLTGEEADKVISKQSDLENFRLLAGLYLIESKNDPLYMIFFLESLIACKENEKRRLLQKLFKEYTSKEEKLDLIEHFRFTKPYQFRTTRGAYRHAMFKDLEKDPKWIADNYGPDPTVWMEDCGGVCMCMDWLADNPQKLNDYLDAVISNLYQMRCAIVHESFPVIMLPDYSGLQDGPSQHASHVDVFPIGSDLSMFVAYETSIRPTRFFEITLNIAKKYLLS
jgi:hypothetical protein